MITPDGALPRNPTVLIIGAGPAGLAAANTLAQGNHQVVVVDRSSISDTKCCAGGISLQSLKILKSLRIPIDREIRHLKMYIDNQQHDYVSDIPIGYTIDRRTLKIRLGAQVEESGIPIYYNRSVTQIIPEQDFMKVFLKTPTGTSVVRPKLVIGATGNNARLLTQLGASSPSTFLKGLQYNFYLPEERITEIFRNQVQFYFGGNISDQGYGWVFPKTDHVSIGIALSLNAPNPRYFLHRLLNQPSVSSQLKQADIKILPNQKYCTALIPIKPSTNLVGYRYMLVGDAAGFVDPITLEGIVYALKSGRLAAQTILDHTNTPNPFKEYRLHQYLYQCQSSILPELRFGQMVRHLIYQDNPSRNWKKAIRHFSKSLRLRASLSKGINKFANFTTMVSTLSGWNKLKAIRCFGISAVCKAIWNAYK